MNEKLRILIVESDIASAMHMKRQFEVADYEVLELVHTGEEAVKITREKNPDFVIMDLGLKGNVNGFMAAQEIGGRLNTDIILMTDYQNMDILERARVIKHVWYFIKPFNIGRIKQVIDSLAAVSLMV